ncbi:hypothetical protein ACWDMR_20795 [Streptomyces althioticus]|jgi:hypothetical protein|uniref:Secreted protein n=2 Tax=Actinomycetes TaxID=1760 RepID=A0A9X5CHC3_9ACTN|nr:MULTISPECIES: hypothetical protein [Actinomycetes]ALV52650.1 hypothetical protein ASR50_26685 [Streptomyces sp. 4F]WTC22588.1 hypothetical protein OG872_07860 [Streptomyces althioticus]KEG39420.1 hypothetical protein DJ64_14680 [Streptomyces griseorubens]MBM4828111.1 hypothetical protein [Actinospica acidiphila]NEC48504.1 hypothetical protein [Actinospica acidiphila]
MKSAAFQKVSVITVAVIALVFGPATVGTAFAEEPGWQTPLPEAGEIVSGVLEEPGWQTPLPEAGEIVSGVLEEPGWQTPPSEPGWQ